MNPYVLAAYAFCFTCLIGLSVQTASVVKKARRREASQERER